MDQDGDVDLEDLAYVAGYYGAAFPDVMINRQQLSVNYL